MITPTKVRSKRETLHLTMEKDYNVIDTIDSSHGIVRYVILSDRGDRIETSVNNFYSISELRKINLNKIIYATH